MTAAPVDDTLLVLLEDLRAAVAAGAQDVFDINRHVQTASHHRGDGGHPTHKVLGGLGHLTRSGEITCTATGNPHRWLYRPQPVHTCTADCACSPVVTAPGVHQHNGPEPRTFEAVVGDDIAATGLPTEIHQ